MVVLRLFVILRRGLWPNTLIWFFHPHNSPLKLQSFSSLRKIGFQFYVTISPTLMSPSYVRVYFHLQWAYSWCFGIWDALAITSHDALSPTFYDVMKIIQWRFFIGIRAGTFPLILSSYIKCSKNPDPPFFESSTLKKQSEMLFPYTFASNL